jgi:glucose/arabinose dehydrogenase
MRSIAGKRAPGPIVAALIAQIIAQGPALAPAQTVADPDLIVETLTSGLLSPTAMAFVGPGDILVLEKATGTVRRVAGGILQPDPVLDVAVNALGERGLLGIAVNTEIPPRVFLYFSPGSDPGGSGADGGTTLAHRLYRYDWNPTLAMLENPVLLLELPHNPVHPCHSGGIVVVGPPAGPGPGDGGFVYLVIGDLGLPGQTSNDPSSVLPDDKAVIFRILQDGAPAPGNPFSAYCSATTSQICTGGGPCPAGETCVTEVESYFAYGVRNSFGLALDPVTDALWETENGPFNYDEINRVDSGFNSGWVKLMGPDSRDPQGIGDLFDMPGAGSTYSDPEFSWQVPIAVTAIAFPAGSNLGPGYDTVALAGDFKNGQIYALPLNGARDGFDLNAYPALLDLVADGTDGVERDVLLMASGFTGITDLKIGPDGNLYVVDLLLGKLFRIRPPGCPSAPADDCKESLIPGSPSLLIRDHPSDDARDRLRWRWLHGEATALEELGNPQTEHSYALCVYDAGGLRSQGGVGAGGTCDGNPCWTVTSGGFRYDDQTAMAGGLSRIRLRAAGDGAAKVVVKGRGVELDVPDLMALASPLTVQLHRGSADACWTAQYSFPPAIENTAELFKDRAD